MPRARLLPWLCLALVACKPSEGGEGERAKTPRPAASPEARAEPEPEPEPAAKNEPPSPEQARALRKQLLAKLNEGRRLSKAGDHEQAIARYREALEIDASDVAVLAELGWAAFKAGDLPLAHATTQAALRFADEDRERGMLLYNLGRIDEARGRPEAAVERYRQSLARRANETVEARLADLLGARAAAEAQASLAAEVEAAMREGLPVLARELPDLDAACARLVRDEGESYSFDPDEPARCNPALVATPGADTSWGLLHLANPGMPRQEAWFPVVRTETGWVLFQRAASSYNPGAFGIYEELEIVESRVDPLLAKGVQLVLRFEWHRSDHDMGVNETQSEFARFTLVCARVGTGARCTVPIASESSFRREILFEELEDEEDFEHADPLPIAGEYAATLDFADGMLEVSAVSEDRDRLPDLTFGGRLLLPEGRYSLEDLLGRDLGGYETQGLPVPPKPE